MRTHMETCAQARTTHTLTHTEHLHPLSSTFIHTHTHTRKHSDTERQKNCYMPFSWEKKILDTFVHKVQHSNIALGERTSPSFQRKLYITINNTLIFKSSKNVCACVFVCVFSFTQSRFCWQTCKITSISVPSWVTGRF